MIGASVAITLALKRNYVGEDLLLLVWIAYAPVGAVIVRRRPDNPIGWLFLIVGLAASLMELARVGEWAALGNGPPLEWWGYVSAWVLTGVAFPLIILVDSLHLSSLPLGVGLSTLAASAVPGVRADRLESPVLHAVDVLEHRRTRRSSGV